MISLFVSSIGLAYFVYGKKRPNALFLISGIIMSVYPYFVSNYAISIIIALILIFMPFIIKV
jgi:hypothetical protein